MPISAILSLHNWRTWGWWVTRPPGAWWGRWWRSTVEEPREQDQEPGPVHSPAQQLQSKVEWFSTFFEIGHIAADQIYSNSKKSAKWATRNHGARAAELSFSKNHRNLKNYYFFKLANTLILLQKHSTKGKFKIKFFKIFCFGSHDGQNGFELEK